MGDGTEPAPLLSATTAKGLHAKVMQCASRKELDSLTIRIWRTYEGEPQNAKQLDELKAFIKARREMLARNNPR